MLCLMDLTWFGLAYVVHPDWAAVAHVPTMPSGVVTSGLVFLVIAIVGTTIAPWQHSFQQSCVAEKRLRFSDGSSQRSCPFAPRDLEDYY